jgi:hypothetical protein
MHFCEIRAYEITTCEMHAYEMHTYEMHAYEMHTYEMHAYEMHAYEMPARDRDAPVRCSHQWSPSLRSCLTSRSSPGGFVAPANQSGYRSKRAARSYPILPVNANLTATNHEEGNVTFN